MNTTLLETIVRRYNLSEVVKSKSPYTRTYAVPRWDATAAGLNLPAHKPH